MATTTIKLKAGILIVSDTAFEDPSTDKTEKILRDVLQIDGRDQWTVAAAKIVPDDKNAIQQTISDWTSNAESLNLIVTSGGTGFAVKDNTPEAVSPMIDRHAPGLVHAMLSASFAVTPFAMMSRPVAGARKSTIILTLPGSPKGAKENLQAVLKLLPHACMQVAGADSRVLHAGGVSKLEKEAGVGSEATVGSAGHHHHHDHSHGHGGHAIPKPHTAPSERPAPNDPSAGAANRHRSSPYPMISVEEALATIFSETPTPTITTQPVNPSLVGSILAEDVKSNCAVPAYRASIVDGYAIVAPIEIGTYPVVSISHASPSSIPPLQAGQIARITTGAPLPPNANAVVMVEDTVLETLTPDLKEESTVRILTNAVKSGENVREIGSDITVGSTVLQKGDVISAVGGELGLLASVGKAEVAVYRKPVVGVLSTGDEIVNHDRPGDLRYGEVRDCNRPALLAVVRGWGFEAVDLGIAKDDPTTLETTLRRILTLTTPPLTHLLTTGGVSMGELDLLKPTLSSALGGTIHFGRVNLKPGKPTTFATVYVKDGISVSEHNRTKKLIFSLPGNPASALVCAQLFVYPALSAFSGIPIPGEASLPRIKVVLGETVRCDEGRPEYVRVRVKVGGAVGGQGGREEEKGMLIAQTTGGQRSSRIGSLSGANALVCLPPGGGILEAGNVVEAILMGRIG
ncbi:MAG: hypothetical protein M1834_007845 [Cirrosporium novae-zelandiae]|nr:MAG: hypothetical protein M1834_007845 [Cirrosporium novae-zelandiae]